MNYRCFSGGCIGDSQSSHGEAKAQGELHYGQLFLCLLPGHGRAFFHPSTGSRSWWRRQGGIRDRKELFHLLFKRCNCKQGWVHDREDQLLTVLELEWNDDPRNAAALNHSGVLSLPGVAVRPVPEAPIASASAQVSNRVMVMEERYQAEKDALYLVLLWSGYSLVIVHVING